MLFAFDVKGLEGQFACKMQATKKGATLRAAPFTRKYLDLNYALRNHCFGNFYEAGNIGTFHVINVVSI